MASKNKGLGKFVFVLIAIIAIAFIYFSDVNSSFDQEVDTIICSSGYCSEVAATDIDSSREADLSRNTLIGGSVCSEQKDAEAYITDDHEYNKFYLFNRDQVQDNAVFNEILGAHSGIAYQLFSYNPETNKYGYKKEEVELVYGDSGYFDLEPGVAYRIDVYFCDIPASLTSCSETDGGLNTEEKGVTTTTFGVYEDYCSSKELLVERFCDKDNTIRTDTIICENSICKDGACVPSTPFNNNKLLLTIVLGAVGLLLLFLIIRRGSRSFGRDKKGFRTNKF